MTTTDMGPFPCEFKTHYKRIDMLEHDRNGAPSEAPIEARPRCGTRQRVMSAVMVDFCWSVRLLLAIPCVDRLNISATWLGMHSVAVRFFSNKIASLPPTFTGTFLHAVLPYRTRVAPPHCSSSCSATQRASVQLERYERLAQSATSRVYCTASKQSDALHNCIGLLRCSAVDCFDALAVTDDSCLYPSPQLRIVPGMMHIMRFQSCLISVSTFVATLCICSIVCAQWA